METPQKDKNLFEQANHISDLTNRLGYSFTDTKLLLAALTVANLIKKSNSPDKYNALATMGDGFLRAIIDDILLEVKADLSKGNLTLTRDKLVNNERLCKIAQRLNLQNYLIDASLKSVKKTNDKILADCLEAIIAAVFLDSDRKYKLVKKVVIKLWQLEYLYNDWLVGAVLQKNIKKVKYLLKCGANPNLQITGFLFSEQDVTAFEIPENVREYIGNNQMQCVTNLLCEIATQDCPEIATLFLEYGADIDTGNCLQSSPLYNAAYSGFANMVELLIKNGAKLYGNACDGYTPFHIAVHQNHAEVVHIILDKLKFNINEVTPYGKSALSIAASFGHYHIAEKLVDYGASIAMACTDQVNKKFTTAIHIAVENNRINLLELFVEKKANLNVIDSDANTPLHMAVKNGIQNAIILLIEHGADIELTNRNGKKPVEMSNDSQIKNLLKPERILNTPKQSAINRNILFQPNDPKENNTEFNNKNTTNTWQKVCSIL